MEYTSPFYTLLTKYTSGKSYRLFSELVMTQPADIRDETCTNLAILLSLLMRNIKPGEQIQLLATKKQLIHIKDIPQRFGIQIPYESMPEDLLITLSKPE